jgi:ERCC4-type nuclease
VVVVDGREKSPYTFSGLQTDAKDGRLPLIVPTEWAYLKTGDYSIHGEESLVAVERKSLADLYSTLGQNRDRFEAEHERMAKMQFAAVVIEASWEEIVEHPPERSRLTPKSVYRTGIAFMERYGVPWLTMGGRRLAEITTFRILERFWRDLQDRGPVAKTAS